MGRSQIDGSRRVDQRSTLIDRGKVSSPEVEKDAAPKEKEPAIEEKKTPPVVEVLAREDGKKDDPVQEMLVP